MIAVPPWLIFISMEGPQAHVTLGTALRFFFAYEYVSFDAIAREINLRLPPRLE